MSKQKIQPSSPQLSQATATTTPQLQLRSFAESQASSASESQTALQETPSTAEATTSFSFGKMCAFSSGAEPTPPPSSPPSFLQPKLTIGQPDDKYEREADQVAAQVVQQINRPQVAEKEEAEEIQRSPAPLKAPSHLQRRSAIPTGQASSDFESNLNRARSGGKSLDAQTQEKMGSAMGADFSGVKVHTDKQADQLSRSIQAKAFTTGKDVFFRQGEYSPGNRGGQELLAHELTHVVQQNSSAVQRRTTEGADSNQTDISLGDSKNSLKAHRAGKISQSIIQAWPAPEVDNQPDPGSMSNYKCHDAVVYWVFLSLGMTGEEATEAVNLCHQKKGSAAGWIVEALGYNSGTRISSASEAAAGDILFTGHTSYVAHTMVVRDSNNIVGFNNFGTFGTAGGGDQYSQEEFSNDKYWHDIDGQQQMGGGKSGSFPVYKVAIGTAKASLCNFLDKAKDLPDYVNHHMNVEPKKKKWGCFITTAVVTARGLPDDCDELMTLRHFRDTYLKAKQNGKALIEMYYKYSPLIVEEMSEQADAGEIYEYLYQVIRVCVDAIKEGNQELAFNIYCDMVIKLKEQFIPEVSIQHLY